MSKLPTIKHAFEKEIAIGEIVKLAKTLAPTLTVARLLCLDANRVILAEEVRGETANNKA